MLRAIIAIPEFDCPEQIALLRGAYDPLAAKIAPHVTFVFPFESSLDRRQLQDHVTKAVQGIPAFPIAVRQVTGHEREYLFLEIERGTQQVRTIHDRLYTGCIRDYLSPFHAYLPHVTVGRVSDAVAHQVALAYASGVNVETKGIISSLQVVRVDPSSQFVTESVVPLSLASGSAS